MYAVHVLSLALPPVPFLLGRPARGAAASIRAVVLVNFTCGISSRAKDGNVMGCVLGENMSIHVREDGLCKAVVSKAALFHKTIRVRMHGEVVYGGPVAAWMGELVLRQAEAGYYKRNGALFDLAKEKYDEFVVGTAGFGITAHRKTVASCLFAAFGADVIDYDELEGALLACDHGGGSARELRERGVRAQGQRRGETGLPGR